MRKRDVLRYIPGFSKVAKALDDLERDKAQLTAEIEQLKHVLYQPIFASETSLVEDKVPGSTEGSSLPIPAGVLRFLVAGTEDLKWFLQSGKLGAQSLVDVLAGQGHTLDDFKRVLDFGCGCGRIVRHLKGVTGTEVHGTDCNPWAIEWCTRYLSFAQFRVNALEPPLPYPDSTFDLIYAFSVFTHLSEPLQAAWMDEMRRVLVPGGLLFLTVHGDKCAEGLLSAERVRYDTGKLVVRAPDVVGTNDCCVFHPERYVRGVLAQAFDVIDFIPEGAKGNPPQDAYLMRSRPQPELKSQKSEVRRP